MRGPRTNHRVPLSRVDPDMEISPMRLSPGSSIPDGPVYLFEAFTNLLDWKPISVDIKQPDGSFAFDDPDGAALSNRFYRVVAPE